MIAREHSVLISPHILMALAAASSVLPDERSPCRGTGPCGTPENLGDTGERATGTGFLDRIIRDSSGGRIGPQGKPNHRERGTNTKRKAECGKLWGCHVRSLAS